MKNISLDPFGPKKPANLSINADLLRQARCEQWLAENRNALDAYNCRVEARGAFGDGLRRF